MLVLLVMYACVSISVFAYLESVSLPLEKIFVGLLAKYYNIIYTEQYKSNFSAYLQFMIQAELIVVNTTLNFGILSHLLSLFATTLACLQCFDDHLHFGMCSL